MLSTPFYKRQQESGNIMAASSFKWSGIANSKTIDIADAGDKNVTVSVTTKVSSHSI